MIRACALGQRSGSGLYTKNKFNTKTTCGNQNSLSHCHGRIFPSTGGPMIKPFPARKPYKLIISLQKTNYHTLEAQTPAKNKTNKNIQICQYFRKTSLRERRGKTSFAKITSANSQKFKSSSDHHL